MPEWLHIGAYPHVSPISRLSTCRYERPANEHIGRQLASEAGLIAMQKVVGSNPISRFRECPARVRVGFGVGRRNQIELSPHIAVVLAPPALR